MNPKHIDIDVTPTVKITCPTRAKRKSLTQKCLQKRVRPMLSFNSFVSQTPFFSTHFSTANSFPRAPRGPPKNHKELQLNQAARPGVRPPDPPPFHRCTKLRDFRWRDEVAQISTNRLVTDFKHLWTTNLSIDWERRNNFEDGCIITVQKIVSS